MAAPPPWGFKTLDATLHPWNAEFSFYADARTRDGSLHQQLSAFTLKCGTLEKQRIGALREAIELHGLLLTLHRFKGGSLLLTDARLRLRSIPSAETPLQIDVFFTFPESEVETEGHDPTQGMLDALVALFDTSVHARLSDEYYEARRKILKLHGVEEAFVHGATIDVGLYWTKSCQMMASVLGGADVVRRISLLSHEPFGPLDPRTNLSFDKIGTEVKIRSKDPTEATHLARVLTHASPWLTTLCACITHEWTTEDVETFARDLKESSVDDLTLRVHSALAFGLALHLFTLVGHMRSVTIIMKIKDDWNDHAWSPLTGTERKSTVDPTIIRSLHIHVKGAKSMFAIARGLLPILKGMDTATDRVIHSCDQLRFKMMLWETDKLDMLATIAILNVVGKSLTSLEIDSAVSYREWDATTVANTAADFRVETLLRQCPKLRLLDMQIGVLDDVVRLFEDGTTKLEALQLQWTDVRSAKMLATALRDPKSKVAQRLVEFSTRVDADEVYSDFTDVLETSETLRLVRLGRRPAGDSLAAVLSHHHNEKLELSGSACTDAMLSLVLTTDELKGSALDAVTADDDLLEAIADFLGPAVYRTIEFK